MYRQCSSLELQRSPTWRSTECHPNLFAKENSIQNKGNKENTYVNFNG